MLALRDRVFGFLAWQQKEPVGLTPVGLIPIGLIMVAESVAIYAAGRFGVITELFVAPGQRSAGTAKRLVDATIRVGLERSWNRIEVGAPRQPAWQRSLNFYLREGFVEVGPRLQRLL